MIGKLAGRIESLGLGNQIILDVNGVGYVVAVSSRTREAIGGEGEAASLWIETQVREDAINLYGFGSIAERDAFRLLTTVQGVGAKSGLSILGILPPDRLAQAIAAGDKAALAQAEGVGPKLALRIVTELKDKAPLIGAVIATGASKTAIKSATPASAGTGPMDDALSALIHLGYKRMEAYAALASVAPRLDSDAKVDQWIRAALSELASGQTGAA